MSTKEKLINRFLGRPKDFTYDELKKLMNLLGYKEVSGGKTSGSRVAFINSYTDHIIRLHKPHPKPVLKNYQLQMLIKELTEQNIIQ